MTRFPAFLHESGRGFDWHSGGKGLNRPRRVLAGIAPTLQHFSPAQAKIAETVAEKMRRSRRYVPVWGRIKDAQKDHVNEENTYPR